MIKARFMYNFCLNVVIIAILLVSHNLVAGIESQLILIKKRQPKASIVVLPDSGKVAAFAATELKKYLDKATGASFEIVNTIPDKGIALIVGDSAETRKLGVSVENLKRDGFIIKCIDNKIVIAGRDDKSYNIEENIKSGQWRQRRPECASIFAVYDFLERIADIRWYFPGKQGEFCPEKETLTIDKLNIKEEPANKFRWAYMYSSRYREDKRKRFHDYLEMGISDQDTVLWTLRNKVSTMQPPLNHMPTVHQIFPRFGKEHPDWFALRDGKRLDHTSSRAYLCYSASGLRTEIKKDVDAYFSGKSPQTRGLTYWSRAVAGDGYYSLLPNDALQICECSDCQKKLSKKTKYSELIWEYVADIARSVEIKHPEKRIVCLAYPPYLKVPESVKLPKNVIGGVTLDGPCGARGGKIEKWQIEKIRAWKKFTGEKVILWTYNCLEVVGYSSLLSGIPKLELKAIERFYKSVRDDISGAFYENEIEYGFQNHLDLYIFLKISWNPNASVKNILQEYCQNMYGNAATEIYEIIDIAEDLWMGKITSGIYEERHQRYKTMPAVNEKDIWTDVYSPDEMKKLRKLINQAEIKTKGTEYAQNVHLFERRFLGPLYEKCSEFNSRRDYMKDSVQATVPYLNNAITIDGKQKEIEWREYNKKKIIVLRPFTTHTGQKRQKTFLRYGWDNKNLYLMFTCEESAMDKIKESKRQLDDIYVHSDDVIEIFLDPSNQRKGCYQILVNPSASITDIKHAGNKRDKSWSSNANFKVLKWRNSKGQHGAWFVEMAIPFASLGGVPKIGDKWAVNFCRSRRSEDPNQVSSWSPYIKDKFYQPEWFGSMTFEGAF